MNQVDNLPEDNQELPAQPAEETIDPGNEVPEEPTVMCYSVRDHVAKVTAKFDVCKITDVDSDKPAIDLPYADETGYTEFVKRMENRTDIFYDDKWSLGLFNAIPLTSAGNRTAKVMSNDGDWHQSLEEEGIELRAGRPTIAKGGSGTNRLLGQQAVARISALTSVGTIVKVPLWHTGIWVSIKAPQLSAWVELDRRLAMEKGSVGRQTRGLSYSNDSVFLISHLVDFVLTHVFDSTLQNWDVETLRNTILTPDFDYLVTCMALTVFPEGHPFSLPCISDAAKCQYVARGSLDLSKTMWVNRKAFRSEQRRHMVKRDQARTAEEVSKYQEYWEDLPQNTIALNEGLKVTYKIPTLAEFIDSGIEWITDVEDQTKAAFGEKLTNSQRQEYIATQTLASRISFYRHWIKSFVIVDDNNDSLVDDPSTISEVIKSISANVEISDKIIDGVKDYIACRTVTSVGIPNYECPNCKAWHLTDKGPMEAIIQIDPVTNFFTLLQSHLEQRLKA